MPDSQLSQSINFSGAQITGDFQVGQAGKDLKQTQFITHDNAQKSLTSTDVIALIQQMENLFCHLLLGEVDKQDALKQLSKIKNVELDLCWGYFLALFWPYLAVWMPVLSTSPCA